MRASSAFENAARGARRVATLAGATLAALLLLWLVYLGLTWDLRDADAGPPPEYAVVEVVRGSLPERVVATGRMAPWARVVVQSEIPGIVETVEVEEGDRVARGQPLVRLDDSRLEDRAAVLRAELALHEARTRVDLMGRAELELAKRRRDHARIEGLRERGVASQEELDDVAHALRLAQIALADARAELDERRAAAERARRSLQRVERDLEKSVIRSPIDGVVVRRPVEIGAAVADLQNGGTVVAELADDRRIHLRGEIDENDVAGVARGQRAEVRIDAFPGEVFSGVVRRISLAGTGEGSVSTFDVEVEVEADERIRVGMSADARIVVREYEDALLIPNAALTWENGKARVRRVDVAGERGEELREIEELYSDGFQTAVASGLAEGDLVLVREDGAN